MLDDSTDETQQVARTCVERYQALGGAFNFLRIALLLISGYRLIQGFRLHHTAGIMDDECFHRRGSD